jgi:hypothetical protein
MKHDITWQDDFADLFERCTAEYEAGRTDFGRWYSADDLAFLKRIGCQPREFFDFVEDFGAGGEMSMEMAVLIAAVRRDYFLHIQKGQLSSNVVPMSTLPAKSADVEGIRWLPRLMAKARAKLRGEMDPDTMFCCGGDRAFFEDHQIHPADFLRLVWAAGDDDQRIIDYVKASR